MAIFKSLTFDGINSLDYGIYITGEAVYNAPERVVEMVSVPGRNGDIAIDQGRFENIEVTYPAGCFADSQADFADKVMRFRNALASRYTYKRLTDEYHSDEYRLGLYKSGLDVDAVRYGTAGQFDITFDCKPQRFLLSGETALAPSDYIDTQTETGEIVTIDSDGSLGVKSLEVSLSPIQEGSGTPSPTNVRPISGRTEVVTHRTGVNVWGGTQLRDDILAKVPNAVADDVAKTIRYTAQDARGKILFDKFKPNTQYTLILKGYNTNQSSQSVNLSIWYTDGTSKSLQGFVNGVSRTVSDASKSIESINGFWSSSTTYLYYDECGVFEGVLTADDFEPYQGNTYTTALGRTVYGGTLDVVSGKLTVDRAMVDLGTLNWAKYTADSTGHSFAVIIPPNMKEVPNNSQIITALCSIYEINKFVNVRDWMLLDSSLCQVGSPQRLIVRDTSYTDATAFKTAMDGVQLCYELATPQTYQLTPQQIDLLLGTNHLWSDGEITVEYGVHPYYNPTQFESKPIIKVTGTGTLGIGEYILTITGTASQTLYIDCETMEIYTIEGTVPTGASSLVSINKNDFPVLKPGINNISVGSGITAVTITPRWWRI